MNETKILIGGLCIGLALGGLGLIQADRKDAQLKTRVARLESENVEIERRYIALSNQVYSQSSAPTNSIPNRAERTKRAADYANQLNSVQVK